MTDVSESGGVGGVASQGRAKLQGHWDNLSFQEGRDSLWEHLSGAEGWKEQGSRRLSSNLTAARRSERSGERMLGRTKEKTKAKEGCREVIPQALGGVRGVLGRGSHVIRASF